MALQKIFTAGNSQVVAIPPELLDMIDLKKGEFVHIVAHADTSSITITKAESKNTKKPKSSLDFKKWLTNVLEEDAHVLENLSNR